MEHFQTISLFLTVAQSSSLSAAAQTAGRSVPTVTRAIDALEARLRVALIERSTRGIRLTESGLRFAHDCPRLLNEIATAEQSAQGLHAEVRGSLTIAAPLLFGQHFLTPVVLAFLEAHPAIRVQAQFTDRSPNLQEEGLDVAVLMGNLPDSSLVVVGVGSARRIVVASPRYLENHGTPETPKALLEHSLVHALGESPAPEWQFHTQSSTERLRFRPRLSLSTSQACLEAAAAGAGIARCMSYQAQPRLMSGQLCRILEAHEPPPLPLYLAYREGRRAAARVRSFVDFAAPRLRAQLALQL